MATARGTQGMSATSSNALMPLRASALNSRMIFAEPSRYWIRYCTLEILALKHPGRWVGGDPPATLRIAAREHCGGIKTADHLRCGSGTRPVTAGPRQQTRF